MRLNQFEFQDSHTSQGSDLPVSLFVVPTKIMGWIPVSRGVKPTRKPPLVTINGTLICDAKIASVQTIMKPGIGLTGVVQFTGTVPIFAQDFTDAHEALNDLLVEFYDDQLNGELQGQSVRANGVITMVKPDGQVIQLFDHGSKPC